MSPDTEEREEEEEGESVLSRALEVFTRQYNSLLESLQSRHKFSLEQILDCGLDSLESRRHRKLASFTSHRQREGEERRGRGRGM